MPKYYGLCIRKYSDDTITVTSDSITEYHEKLNGKDGPFYLIFDLKNQTVKEFDSEIYYSIKSAAVQD